MSKRYNNSRNQFSETPMANQTINIKKEATMDKATLTTAKSFNIRNVELDIYMDKSSSEIAAKFGKTEDDIIRLIERAYTGKPSKVRELKKRLEKSDEAYKRRAVRAFNEAEKARTARVTELSIPHIEVNSEKTEIQLQREYVQSAEALLSQAKELVADFDKQYQEAVQKQREAVKALREAEKQKETADDEVRRCESRKASAIVDREACQKEYDRRSDILQQLCSKGKLMHASALKKERKRIEGMVYVSRWDYDHMDDCLKGLVNPVDTAGVNLRKYPMDFIWYPEKMGLDAYRSAVECALAFIKLREANDELEVICCDEVVEQLVKMQEVSM